MNGLVTYDKTELARSKLKPEQIFFGEWLATPSAQREPATQVLLAKQFGINEATLCNWKKIPELRYVIDDILGLRGRELVPEAIAKLKDCLNSTDAKVAFEAAKDILNRWGEVSKHGTIIASIKDLYEHYHPV